MLTGAGVGFSVAVARPVFLEELGSYLKKHREALGWKQSHAAALAQRRGLTAINRANIIALEAGKIKHPRRDLINQVADLYTMDATTLWRMVTDVESVISAGVTTVIEQHTQLVEQNRTMIVTLGQIQTLVSALQKALDGVTFHDTLNVIQSASSQHSSTSQGDAADDAAPKDTSRPPEPGTLIRADEGLPAIRKGLTKTRRSFQRTQPHRPGDGVRTPEVDVQRDAGRSRRRRKNA